MKQYGMTRLTQDTDCAVNECMQHVVLITLNIGIDSNIAVQEHRDVPVDSIRWYDLSFSRDLKDICCSNISAITVNNQKALVSWRARISS